jgi:hypothetical protein
MRVGEITQCVSSKGSNYTFPVWLNVQGLGLGLGLWVRVRVSCWC